MLPAVALRPGVDLEIEAGDKILRIWQIDDKEVRTGLLEWFTTEKVLFDKSRGRPGISGFERYQEAYTYDLLYVGIAKVAEAKGVDLPGLTLAELQQFSPLIENDVYGVLTVEGSLASRNHIGGTAPAQVRAAIARARKRLD